ncbi:head maturation protease, ClpP-related [Lactococcus garvieae]
MLELILNGPVVDGEDALGYEWFGVPCISPNNVARFLQEANGQEITVLINSKGGSVFAGSEIYTRLKNYSGKVNVVVSGIAASIASVIALAGDTVKISPLGQFMIHNASARNEGDFEDMSKFSNVLFGTSESIAKVYASKTGKSVDEMMDYMKSDSYFTADKAVELGFADEVLFSEQSELELVASAGEVLDKAKISEFKSFLFQNLRSKETGIPNLSLNAEEIKNLISSTIDQKLESLAKEKEEPQKSLIINQHY